MMTESYGPRFWIGLVVYVSFFSPSIARNLLPQIPLRVLHDPSRFSSRDRKASVPIRDGTTFPKTVTTIPDQQKKGSDLGAKNTTQSIHSAHLECLPDGQLCRVMATGPMGHYSWGMIAPFNGNLTDEPKHDTEAAPDPTSLRSKTKGRASNVAADLAILSALLKAMPDSSLAKTGNVRFEKSSSESSSLAFPNIVDDVIQSEFGTTQRWLILPHYKSESAHGMEPWFSGERYPLDIGDFLRLVDNDVIGQGSSSNSQDSHKRRNDAAKPPVCQMITNWRLEDDSDAGDWEIDPVESIPYAAAEEYLDAIMMSVLESLTSNGMGDE